MPSDSHLSSPKGNRPVLKIFLGLLPALVFAQAYGWMTLYKHFGIAFLIIWALVVFTSWQLTQKNRAILRIVRLLEIGFFFLPIATIVMTFVLGSSAKGGAAAVGAGIGGIFVTGIAFVIGIAGGAISHLVGNSYAKKADSEPEETPSFANQHGIAAMLAGLFLISIVLPQIPAGSKPGSNPATNATTSTVSVTDGNATATQASAPAPSEPAPVEIVSAVVTKDVINQPEADVVVKNGTKKTIAALKIRFLVYTKFDEPVKNAFSFTDDSNEYVGIAQQDDILPGAKKSLSWQLTGFDTAGKVKAELYQVKFTDGSEWKSPEYKD